MYHAARVIERKSRSYSEYKGHLKATSGPHSGDWFFALPVTSCSLRLDDEAVRVAVALRLGLPLGTPHMCQCGAEDGIYGLICMEDLSRSIRYQHLITFFLKYLFLTLISKLKGHALVAY